MQQQHTDSVGKCRNVEHPESFARVHNTSICVLINDSILANFCLAHDSYENECFLVNSAQQLDFRRMPN
jgi:hypothetical protein